MNLPFRPRKVYPESRVLIGGCRMNSENNSAPQTDSSVLMLSAVPGHPLGLLLEENRKISVLIEESEKALASGDPAGLAGSLKKLRSANVHYKKNGDLIYPVLKERCPSGNPADEMWDAGVEIKDELLALAEENEILRDTPERLKEAADSAENLSRRESEELYPLCAEKFTEEDWMRIYFELPAYGSFLTEDRPVWAEAEARRTEFTEKEKTSGAGASEVSENSSSPIPLGTGHMTPKQIEAVLNTIPMELTFVDDHDRNCYFNAGEKLFKRPAAAIGREVYSCHPPRYEMLVDQTIEELRSGEKESSDIWMERNGEPVLVRYMAVRDEQGTYLGTLECVQKMGFARDYFKD